MKLYAQVGYGPGDKLTEGLASGLIDGAVFSPKDSGPDKLPDLISNLQACCPDADLFIDPQYYTALKAEAPNAKLGKLPDWGYYQPARKGRLEVGSNIDKILKAYFEEVKGLPVTGVIAPNIYISQSLDSREAVIAKNFVRQARAAYDEIGGAGPLYATLALSREALLDQREFGDFLNDITMMDNPPDGFYLLVASRATELKTDIFHTDVVANWMLLNHSLKVNCFDVINGYSDLMSPFLGAVGGDAGCTGWYQNLRRFAMDRFYPERTGGRLPVIRYLSRLLLNRVTFFEKEQLEPFIPGVVNGLPLDAEYTPDPERSREVLQSWEALRSLLEEVLASDEISENLNNCEKAVAVAQAAYADIGREGIDLDRKSDGAHLIALAEGIARFKELAEVP